MEINSLALNLHLFLLRILKLFRRFHSNKRSEVFRCCKPPPCELWGTYIYLVKWQFIVKSFGKCRKIIISSNLYPSLTLNILMYTVSFLPGVVCYTSACSNNSSIQSSSSSLISFFLLPALFSKFIFNLRFLARLSITSTFFRGLKGSNLSVLWTLQVKTCLVVNEDVLDVDCSVAFVDTLCCSWALNLFFQRYSLTRAASFFLNSLYFSSSRNFFFTLSVLFLGASLAL